MQKLLAHEPLAFLFQTAQKRWLISSFKPSLHLHCLRCMVAMSGPSAPGVLSVVAQRSDCDIETTWDFISQGLDRIMSHPQNLDKKSYMSLYEAIYKFSTKQPYSKSYPYAFQVSDDLYGRLDIYLKRHVQSVQVALMNVVGDDGALIKLYASEWKRYIEAARLNNNLFRFVNRHWVAYNTFPGSRIIAIFPLHLKRWKEGMFTNTPSNDILNALLRLIEKREGQHLDQQQTIETDFDFVALLEEVNVALDENTWGKLDIH